MLGIASGEQLRIIWPGTKHTASGPDERSSEPLAMFAMLFPEKLADAAMAEVERMANDPVPHSERPARIAALEREIDELSHAEEALVEAAIARGATVYRSPSALPHDRLDVAVLPQGWFFSVSNDTAGWVELVARLHPLAVSAIGLEPSGGYERGIIRALLAAGLSVRRVNPNKLRQFARARGVLAKNDRLDAQLIAEYVARWI